MSSRLMAATLFMIVCACETNPIKSVKKVEVVDPDYGILSTADKTRDRSRPLGWRCFPVKDVKVDYRTWRGTDGMGSSDIIVTMCDFEIFVESASIMNEYHGRRAKEVTYCNEFQAAWKKITRGEKHVCLDAEPSIDGIESANKVNQKPLMTWTWDKIKTKKGCYSFWDGYDC